MQRLIERGRREGALRTEVPTAWLTAVMHALMHAAVEEAAAGRLATDEVPRTDGHPGTRSTFVAPHPR